MDNRRGDPARGSASATEELAVDEAIFSPEHVGRGKRSFPVLAASVLGAGVVALALAGMLGRVTPAPEIAEVPVATKAPELPGFQMTSKRFAEGPYEPTSALTPGRIGRPLLAVDGQTSAGLVFVHGDVFTLRAVVVVVSVTDARDRTLGITSVDMPGGSTAFRLGANDRFTVAFEIGSSPTMQPQWIIANAYDDHGMIIASARARVGSPA